jgi:hypothetical protein
LGNAGRQQPARLLTARRLLSAIAVALPLLVVLRPMPAADASGRLVVVGGSGPAYGSGPRIRYRVAVESGIGEDRSAFAVAVHKTLGDRRDWSRRNSFRRVSSSPYRFTVVLVSANTTDQLCYPFRTGGIYSCYNNGRVVINDYRWRHPPSTYSGRLPAYRIYLVSHEVGHALGHQHRYDCLASGLAPVMMQQTKSLYGCKRNPWPFPWAG